MTYRRTSWHAPYSPTSCLFVIKRALCDLFLSDVISSCFNFWASLLFSFICWNVWLLLYHMPGMMADFNALDFKSTNHCCAFFSRLFSFHALCKLHKSFCLLNANIDVSKFLFWSYCVEVSYLISCLTNLPILQC